MGHSTVGDGGASVLGLKEVKVVGHGRLVTHDARVHGKAVLVAWPWQLERRGDKTRGEGWICDPSLHNY